MSFNAKDNYDDSISRLSLPDKLSQGFYLIDAALGDSRDQAIIQISDLPVQVVADNDKAIIWVNDISTGKASAGAAVYDVNGGKTYRTDADGIAVISRELVTSDPGEQFSITSTNGKTCIWLYPTSYYYYNWYNTVDPNEAYWTTLQLDRTLFKRDDTLSFFGFAQDRKNSEGIKSVTAVLTQGFYYDYYYYGTRDILHRQTVPVQNGSYSDKIKLPNLDVGSYCLTIYHGDIVLSSTYFTVQDYGIVHY
jgi:uncharacterized protein YfaS (alpha-2-macroglobulin family)